jgi:hypothetical protein
VNGPAGQLTVVVEVAWPMVKVFESLLEEWLASPAKLALAVAVPALMLFVWFTVSDWLSPPIPVTVAVHGACAEPSKVNGPAGQLTVVVEVAWPMVKVFESLLEEWLASPAKLALAVAVPALVLFV